MGTNDRRDERAEPQRFDVRPTSDRKFAKEYIAQLNERTLTEAFPGTSEGEFLLIRNRRERREGQPCLRIEIHTRIAVNDAIEDGCIGLDFTLRTAIGAPSELELALGDADSAPPVEVESIANPEQRRRRRRLNWFLGVRPQLCRVRMGVFPDLEDKVCRLPRNTMEIIGVENGENVTIESTRGDRIVRGMKTFEINDEREATKERQKDRYRDRYPSCEDLLGLKRIRRTEVDIPEIWIDEETRVKLGLQDQPKSGVCQPVRVYRDTWYLFQQRAHQFAIPLVIAVLAVSLEIGDLAFRVGLWSVSVLVWIGALALESRSRLS